tara:strand:- start:1671 stop:2630 length:960 start_codon:yes stop_codon:yes gene_type:complete
MTTLTTDMSLLDKFEAYLKEKDPNISNQFIAHIEDFKKTIDIPIKRVPSWASLMSSSYSSDDNISQRGSSTNLNKSFTSDDKNELSDDENPMENLFSNEIDVNSNLNFDTIGFKVDFSEGHLLDSSENEKPLIDPSENDTILQDNVDLLNVESKKQKLTVNSKKTNEEISNNDNNYIVHTGISKKNLKFHIKEIHAYLKSKCSKTKKWRASTCENILNDQVCENEIDCAFSHNFLLCKKNHKNSINSTNCRICNLKLPDECQDMLKDSFCCKPYGSQEFVDDKCSNTHGWKCYECKSNNKHNTELCLFCYGPRVNIDCF